MNATEKWVAKNIKLFRSEGYSVFKQLVAVREGIVNESEMVSDDYNPPVKYVVALENVNKLWR